MALESVAFITAEDGGDLIVSFALATGEPGEVRSLTLLRTPKYEPWLPEAQRVLRAMNRDGRFRLQLDAASR